MSDGSPDSTPPDSARDEALERLAGAAREVNRRIRTTTAPATVLNDALESLESVSAALDDHLYDGPHYQVGLGPDDMRDFTTPGEFFPYSPVIGRLNPVAPPVEMWITDAGEVHGRMTLTEPFNGPPWDNTHGGVVALVFDELLGLAAIAGAGGGFTGRLMIRYRKPTPIQREVTMRAWLDKAHGRKIVAKGEMHDGDTLTAEAEGLFIRTEGALTEPEE